MALLGDARVHLWRPHYSQKKSLHRTRITRTARTVTTLVQMSTLTPTTSYAAVGMINLGVMALIAPMTMCVSSVSQITLSHNIPRKKRIAPQPSNPTRQIVKALPVWEKELEGDEDRDFIINGIKYGFKLVDGPTTRIEKLRSENHSSAIKKADKVEKRIKEEIADGNYVITEDKEVTLVSPLAAIRNRMVTSGYCMILVIWKIMVLIHLPKKKFVIMRILRIS